MSLVTYLIITTLSSFLGTLTANLSILWIIGKVAKANDKKRIEAFKLMQEQALETYNREVERRREYIKLES